MTATIRAGADGDNADVDVRMVVAPCPGTFHPAPIDEFTTEGEVLRPGTVLGHVEGPGVRAEAASFCDGILVRLLAHPGERVTAGQPLAWIHPVDPYRPPALADPVRSDGPVPDRRPPTFPARFLGVGGHVPHTRVTNDDLATRLDTSDEWIRTRTGIRARHVAGSSGSTTELAVNAARAALADAGVPAGAIGLVVVATSTPDSACPSTAARVADALGMEAGGFDVNGACCGFVHALATAAAMAQDPSTGPVLVIGADRYSTLVDPDDRSTAVLFGDGAGAVVLAPAVSDPDTRSGARSGSGGDRVARRGAAAGPGILATDIGGAPATLGILEIPPSRQFLAMDGPELFRLAVRALSRSAGSALERAGSTIADVDLWVPHQANERIIAAAARSLDLPAERVVLDVAERANTSAASIPLALAEAHRQGRLGDGTRVLLSGVGAGLGWATLYLRWGR